MISQFAIPKRGGRRFAPYVFTEHGVSMLSTVLNSERAIEVNINIMRVFVKLRHYALSQTDSMELFIKRAGLTKSEKERKYVSMIQVYV